MVTVLLFVVIEFLLSACIYAEPHLSYWAIAIAVCPMFMIFFHRKPTLKSCQKNYSTVFSLAYGTLLMFAGSNLCSSKPFYSNGDEISFYLIFLGAFIALSCGISLLLAKFFKKHHVLFSFGALFAVAFCCIPQNGIATCAVTFGLLTLSAACISAAAMVLHSWLQQASEVLKVDDVSNRLLARNLSVVATAVNLFYVLLIWLADKNVLKIAELSANIVCGVLDFILIFVYLRQPMNYVSEQKIRLLQKTPEDVDSEKVESLLRQRLDEEKLFPFAAFLMEFLGLFCHVKTVGLEKVKETSTVFVANHYEIYGPFVSVLKFPKTLRPWTDSMMTNKKTLARQLRSGVDVATKKWLIKPIRKRLPKMIASLMWKTLNYGRPISVYRKDPQKIQMMFNETNDALQAGDSIFVFPEKTPAGEHYKLGAVDKFQTGFVEIAEHYFQATGKELNFYPVYIDKRGKQMTVGEKVSYDSAADIHDEKTRISEELFGQMQKMAENGCTVAKIC